MPPFSFPFCGQEFYFPVVLVSGWKLDRFMLIEAYCCTAFSFTLENLGEGGLNDMVSQHAWIIVFRFSFVGKFHVSCKLDSSDHNS
ncbi:hypothetical protein VNO77_25839 [Canavalia gladiata]|uniref:Uncharacterized protein n=1 Tax=Canavalia gladiata TaxID=3824 RepID=A0AAN9Q939_CANGL